MGDKEAFFLEVSRVGNGTEGVCEGCYNKVPQPGGGLEQ